MRLGVVVLFFILVHGRGLNLFKNLGKASDGVSEYTMERGIEGVQFMRCWREEKWGELQKTGSYA